MHTAYMLVRNLESTAGHLRFRTFRLWQIPQGDVTKLSRARQVFPHGNVRFGDWVLEREYDLVPPSKGPAPSGFGRIPSDVEDILLLLRLFKSGDLCFVQVAIRDYAGSLFSQYPYRVMSDIGTTLPYFLSEGECDAWESLHSELTRTPAWDSRWFDIARRFFLYGGAKEFNWYVEEESKIEQNEVDRVVDYMVALEATLVPEREFVGRCLRERAARLLQRDGMAGSEVKELLREFYDIRSTIAHGSPLSQTHRKTLTKYHCDFEDTVRELLKGALRGLPRDERNRRERLSHFWSPSDSDRAQKVAEAFGAITSSDQRKRLIARLAQRS